MAEALCSVLPCYQLPCRQTRALATKAKCHSASLLPSSFKNGSVHFTSVASASRNAVARPKSISVRCEQGGTGKNNGLDQWLSRAAMVGFAAAISIELATGKGVLENVGFTAPLPTLALALTALVGATTAFFIFQSTSQD